MNDSERTLNIRWKGAESGPFSHGEIEGMLARDEISLIHSVCVEGTWMSIGQYVRRFRPRPRHADETRAQESPLPANTGYSEETYFEDALPDVAGEVALYTTSDAESELRDRLTRIGYMLCGAAFVLPVLATIPAIGIARRLRNCGLAETAKLQTALSLVFTVFGFLFWMLLISAS